MLRVARIVAALALLFSTAPEIVRADADPVDSRAVIDDFDLRLEFLSERLDAGEPGAQLWFWSWTIGYGTASLAQAIAYPLFTDRQIRANLLVGTIGAGLGCLMMLMPPLPAAWAVSDWRERPEETEAQRRAKVEAGEELLLDSAEAEEMGRAWFVHLLGGAVAVAGGLVLWLAYDYPIDGAVTFGLGIAATEAQVWTEPTRAIDDLADYRARFGDPAGLAASTGPSWGFVPFPGGLGIAGAW